MELKTGADRTCAAWPLLIPIRVPAYNFAGRCSAVECDTGLYARTRIGITREELFGAFKNQAYDAVMPRHSIQSGDTVYVPGSVIHIFGPGRLIFEVQ